jgi:hypothetical protein
MSDPNQNLAGPQPPLGAIASNTKTASELIAEFISLRDSKKVATDRVSDYMKQTFNDRMFEIQCILGDMLNSLGTDSIKDNDVGIAFKSVSRSVTHADKKAFAEYVLANQAWHLVDWTASKTAVVEQLEAGHPLPPGLNFSAEYVINIRKA